MKTKKKIFSFMQFLKQRMNQRREKKHKQSIWLIIILSIVMSGAYRPPVDDNDRIRPYTENSYFWQYRGKPILLLGGSREDNLFNHPEGLAEHLDTLAACGGNYIRNTMSSRDPGNPWAFKKLESGLYDLNQWNEVYWQRFERLLKLAAERDIVVQIEIWDPWDYFKTEAAVGFGDQNVGWESCPYNPALNLNYTAEETGLAEVIDYHVNQPGKHLFFQTPPTLKDITQVRRYQEAFIEKMLDIALEYPNVLYNIRNECRESIEWSQYWAQFIRAFAQARGKNVCITDMRRSEHFDTPEQIDLFHDREHFDFGDISQNNHLKGQSHYDQIVTIRRKVMEYPVPLNNIKVYGGTLGWTAGVSEGIQRFWRNVFGGCASTRFHREGPSSHRFGIGLSELAQTQIRSMRMLTDAMRVFICEPHNDLLKNRADNEAYCLSEPGRQYAVYFKDGGEVSLNVSEADGPLTLRWLDVDNSAWLEPETVTEKMLPLKAPGMGQWAVLVLAK